MLDVLRRTEQHLARLVVQQWPAPVGQHLHPAHHRRPVRDLVEPALEVREVGPGDALVLPRAQPGEDGDVGDAVVGAAEVLAVGQALVHHAVEPAGLVGVAVDGVGDLLGRIDAKVVRLTEHRADAAHLEHQPLQHLVLATRRRRQKAPALAGQVEQDRARFEERDRLAVGAVGIDDGRYLVVGAYGEEFGRELLARADVDRVHAVRQAALLEHDVDLVAVGRGPRIHFNHRAVPLAPNGCDSL